MFSFEMLCKQLVSRVSSGDQTLENNKTLALRARVSYRYTVFSCLDPLMKHSNSLFTYNMNILRRLILYGIKKQRNFENAEMVSHTT